MSGKPKNKVKTVWSISTAICWDAPGTKGKELDREGSVEYSTVELTLEIDAHTFTNSGNGNYKLYFDNEADPLVTGEFAVGLDPMVPTRIFTNQGSRAVLVSTRTLTGIDIDIPGAIMGSEWGSISYHRWNGISGTQVSDLTSDPDYPDNPDETTTLSSFDVPRDVAEHYGGRILGYLHPVETGQYTFWIAADDMCELSLSTDFDPANKVRIAWHNNWTERYDWDKNETQESDPITLEAGEIYYIEAIFKEHEGGDNCAVAWQGPGIPERVVIPGSYLSPVHDGECTTIAYYIDGLSEQVQLGSRLEVEFAGEPIDAGNLPCEPGGANQYVFTHETEVDQVIAGMGLNYFGARYYDAEIGRWITPDAAGEFYDLYRYTTNPVVFLDLKGLAELRYAVFYYEGAGEAENYQAFYSQYLKEGDELLVRSFSPQQKTEMFEFLRGGDKRAIGAHSVWGAEGIMHRLFGEKLSFRDLDFEMSLKQGAELIVDACFAEENLPAGQDIYPNLEAAEGTSAITSVPEQGMKALGIDVPTKKPNTEQQ